MNRLQGILWIDIVSLTLGDRTKYEIARVTLIFQILSDREASGKIPYYLAVPSQQKTQGQIPKNYPWLQVLPAVSVSRYDFSEISTGPQCLLLPSVKFKLIEFSLTRKVIYVH